MAYDAYDSYDRVQRGGGEPVYTSSNHSNMSAHSSRYSPNLRDNLHNYPSSAGPRSPLNPQRRPSPSLHDRMSSSDRDDISDHDGLSGVSGVSGVSPEVIAAITEKVKRELFEHLKQNGSFEENAKPSTPSYRPPSVRTSSTPSPPPQQSTARKIYTPPSPVINSFNKPANSPSPLGSPRSETPTSSSERGPNVRFSNREPSIRPSVAARGFSGAELSTIDLKWGRLFDNEGNPTQRLGQFLRGLANHMIEDFAPKKSIVITPEKMATFYTTHAIENEVHPLVSIFKAQSNTFISQLYQDLGCQHFFVQDNANAAPCIPALTPVGFAHWLTINILAYPEEEAKRFEKVVMALPIDADGEFVDGKPERLPKQISRHLLPNKEDRQSRKILNKSIDDLLDNLDAPSLQKAKIDSFPSSRSTSEIPATGTSPSKLATTPKSKPLERERMPYTGTPSVGSGSEEGVKIERERKPYSGHSGGGRVYTDTVPTEATNLSTTARPSRSNSTSQSRDKSEASERRHYRTHSNSIHSQSGLPHRSAGRRPTSPGLKSYGSSTTGIPDISSSSFPSQAQSQSYTSSYGLTDDLPPPPPRDRGYSRDERSYKRPTDDEDRIINDFESPRDAERWDRYQESRASADPDYSDRISSYDRRGSVTTDPRIDPRDKPSSGAAYEDWYRYPRY